MTAFPFFLTKVFHRIYYAYRASADEGMDQELDRSNQPIKAPKGLLLNSHQLSTLGHCLAA